MGSVKIGLDTCGVTRRDSTGLLHVCALTENHTSPHICSLGEPWEPLGKTLERLRARWGASYQIAWAGERWIAQAHRTDLRTQTVSEPTPWQLEEQLRRKAVTR